jgi:hypothetical protein
MHEFKIPCSKLQKGEFPGCPFPEMKKLPCGHIQQLPCSTPLDASLCDTQVEFEMSCLHLKTIRCGLPADDRQKLAAYCTELVRKKLLCGHPKWMKCNEDPTEFDCGVDAEPLLDCGHLFQYACPGKSIDAFILSCEQIVHQQMPCGHTQKITCSKPLTRCLEEIVRVLDCGHSVKSACWNTTPTCTAIAEKTLACGHQQSVQCNIDSVVCIQLSKVLHPVCSHLQLVPCLMTKDETYLGNLKCKMETLKMLNCGHEILFPCSQDIDENVVCTSSISFTLPCNHTVKIPCISSDSTKREMQKKEKCKAKCRAPLDCGHGCLLRCHDQAIAHVCNQIVSKQLECGHYTVGIFIPFPQQLYNSDYKEDV